jgi:hypothetical protein
MAEAARMVLPRNLKVKEMTPLEQQVRGYHLPIKENANKSRSYEWNLPIGPCSPIH